MPQPLSYLLSRILFNPVFWQNVIATATTIPQGEEPAYWPARVLLELDDMVRYRNSSNYSPRKAAFAAKLAPIHDSLRKIKTAYSIIAYPHCKFTKRAVASFIDQDRRRLQAQGAPRTQFELSDTELGILRRLCEAPRYTYAEQDEHGRHYDFPVKIVHPTIPFDPQKRIFRYSEVPAPTL